MEISELGEFGLIEYIAGIIGETGGHDSEAEKNLILGIGDDAAAWRGEMSVQLATADTLVQDIHFSLDFISWRDLGWRAMSANLSDIAAMGGIPRYALVSISIPGSTAVENIGELYRGMTELARQHGTIVIGGNLSGAPLVVINITVLGAAGDAENIVLTRSAAMPGDEIAVTGWLGSAAGGLELLKTRLETDPESYGSLKQAFLRPVPRIKEGRILVEKGVRAAIDISDGLIADLGHICKASNAGAQIRADLVPVHPALKKYFGERALSLALGGGEDYELLFTAPAFIIKNVREAASCPVTVIGEITPDKPGGVVLADENGNRLDPAATGWKHFIPER